MKINQISSVLLIEDNPMIADCYKGFLEDEPITWTHVETGGAALKYLQKTIPQVIVLDLGLPDINGIEIIKYIKQHQLNCAIIVITGQNAIDLVVKVMRYGIFDFLEKPVQANRLIATLHQALSIQKNRFFSAINSHLTPEENQQFHQFIGVSSPMQEVYQTIVQIAKGDAAVLITGETGTGKELCADAIHQESHRQNKPFVVFNCADIPPNLMESQLFGHVKGAFTGAEAARVGAALTANGGTLFLDEIGEMDLELQKKLLRFVETSRFSQLGSDKVQTVDIRLLSATNRHLPTEVKEGRFREDLYYRLKTIAIQLPPLRDRGNDVLLLSQRFLKQYTLQAKKSFQNFDIRAEKLLLHCKWPGNVRQLKSCIQSVVLMNEGDFVTSGMLIAVMSDDMCCEPETITHLEPPFEEKPNSFVAIKSDNVFRSFKEIEKDIILAAIQESGGNADGAAKLLKISSATIYRKKKQWQIEDS